MKIRELNIPAGAGGPNIQLRDIETSTEEITKIAVIINTLINPPPRPSVPLLPTRYVPPTYTALPLENRLEINRLRRKYDGMITEVRNRTEEQIQQMRHEMEEKIEDLQRKPVSA